MLASIPELPKETFEDINSNFSEYIRLPFRDLNLSHTSDVCTRIIWDRKLEYT